jgi:SAM-dependent methyltransferase
MDPDYGKRYRDLYHRHWWWRARETFLIRLLQRWVGPSSNGEVLDFGCGDGLFLSALKEFGDPQGIETDVALLDPSGPWRDRISTNPLEPDRTQAFRYRLILALDVLEHIEDPRPVVGELAYRLAPGGWFVATVPAFQSLWTLHDELNHHQKRYRLGELRELVEGAGLEVAHARYFFAWLALPKWVLARVERWLRARPRPPAVPPRPINSAAFALSRLEQACTGTLPVPFGSSALVVARRRG